MMGSDKKGDVDKNQNNHSHSKHMWMMAICCGVPVIAFLAIAALGVSSPSLETVIAVICPIGMVGMMVMMHRDSNKNKTSGSCCKTEKLENDQDTDTEILTDKGSRPAGSPQPDVLKA